MALLRVTLKQGADLTQVKTKSRVYLPEKNAWLKEYFELLCDTEVVDPNPKAICARVAMALPKGTGKGYRLVADFCSINGQYELVPGPMRNPEIEDEKCAGAVAFGTMDCLQGYWQCPLAGEAREYFTFVTGDSLFTPTRVPQGVMIATWYVILSGDDDGGLRKFSGGCLFDLCVWREGYPAVRGRADSESACAAVVVHGARVVPCGAQARTVCQRGQIVRQTLLGDGRQTRPKARAWTSGDVRTRDGSAS